MSGSIHVCVFGLLENSVGRRILYIRDRLPGLPGHNSETNEPGNILGLMRS